MRAIRILVVDDFPQWQRFLRNVFEPESDLNIVDFASNGLEAVQKSTELQPDVVLMDLSMPVMNGLEATRRIRVASPNSRVLFLSEHCSHELVSAAFEAGASGYVLKSDSSAGLVPGIRRILENERFMSENLRLGSEF